jgi:hypothetical protein
MGEQASASRHAGGHGTLVGHRNPSSFSRFITHLYQRFFENFAPAFPERYLITSAHPRLSSLDGGRRIDTNLVLLAHVQSVLIRGKT